MHNNWLWESSWKCCLREVLFHDSFEVYIHLQTNKKTSQTTTLDWSASNARFYVTFICFFHTVQVWSSVYSNCLLQNEFKSAKSSWCDVLGVSLWCHVNSALQLYPLCHICLSCLLRHGAISDNIWRFTNYRHQCARQIFCFPLRAGRRIHVKPLHFNFLPPDWAFVMWAGW